MRTILLVISFWFITTNAQEIKIIDLAQKNTHTKSIKVKEDFKIKIINRNPNYKYFISTETSFQEIEALTYSEKAFDSTESATYCQEFENLKIELKKSKESEIPKISKKIKEFIKKMETDTTGCKEYILAAKELLRSTSLTLQETFNLKKGEQLEVKIQRKIDSIKTKDSIITWKTTYKTPSRGKWITSYGFAFATNTFHKETTYFTKQNDEDFTITKKEDRKKIEYIPTVFFTWLPNQDLNENISWGFTAGLGYDLDSPSVFLGGSLFYNQNISLVVGLTAYKQDFLVGQYKENQIIKENLEYESLHNKLYTVNPFIAVTFRFDKNIFKTKTKEEIE